MSKKKTTSNEEKLDICVDFFLENREPFSLKELEKRLPKFNPAIKFPLVKDLLTQLTADSRIDTDKIGSSNQYWLFPSAASESRKRKKQELQTQVDAENVKKAKLEEEIKEAEIGKEDTEERRKYLNELEEIRKEREEVMKQLKRYEDLDPELIEKIKSDVSVCKDAANRWTDNVFALVMYCKKNFNMDQKSIYERFEIPEEFDNIE
ncbi:hypothetical protein FDP41_001056 [Naegleria fowleri]|uniref:Meiotic nuclear division protein 1 homolog n=1 Tax=Naegleria fowleri TaxID=5763 RepID=A0A6A5BPF4_NAEFO|nr:uncharacterized protein FDP41_001056 [Naegleria fowleri]KAF0979903.1 hypothetical protein FDP41_001056 [Naegleria fowleri]CAG4708188.1 unnamed protein product [Naegleria fowleri]